LGIGHWAQSPLTNPQSPIPNPQSPFKFIFIKLNIKIIIIKKIIRNKINKNGKYI